MKLISREFQTTYVAFKRLKEEVLKEVAINLPITKGARRLIDTLKSYGFKTAILSVDLLILVNIYKMNLVLIMFMQMN